MPTPSIPTADENAGRQNRRRADPVPTAPEALLRGRQNQITNRSASQQRHDSGAKWFIPGGQNETTQHGFLYVFYVGAGHPGVAANRTRSPRSRRNHQGGNGPLRDVL